MYKMYTIKINYIIPMHFPVYDQTTPQNVYLNDLREYNTKLIAPKYNLILEFINKIIPSSIKNLKDFQIDLDKINKQKLKEILNTDYKYILEGELQITINEIKLNIIEILSSILNSINYSLHKTIINNKTFLTITNKHKIV